MSDPTDTKSSTVAVIPEGGTGTVRASVDSVRKLTWLDSGPGHVMLSTLYFLIAVGMIYSLTYVVDSDVRTLIASAIGLLLGVFKDTVTRFFQKAGDNE